MLHEAFCAGAMSEGVAMEGASVQFRTLSASDRKVSARRLLATRGTVEHVFADMADQIAGVGHCFIHSRQCKLLEAPDFAVGGLPCQPFSKMRSRNGSSSKQGDPKAHPGFEAVTVTFKSYLEARRPKGFLVEESVGMMAADRSTGESYLQDFVNSCAELGYSVRAVRLNHRAWCEMPRDRLPVRSKSLQ